MTPATVTGLAQSLPMLSDTRPDSSLPEDRSVPPAAIKGAISADGSRAVVDRVSLSDQSRQTVAEARQETTLIEEAKKEKAKKDAAQLNSNEKAGRSVANVQFVYDVKGELKVRYMDTADRLIYQVPSELMLRLKEAAAKSESSVNTNA